MRFVIRTMDDSRLVGAIELLVNAESLTGSIGYSLASTHWNRGLMTEAVGLLTREATSVWHLRQIRARCSATNLASRKVLERNGFTLSGVHPNDEWVNVRFEDTCHYVYRGPRDQLGQA
jgi:ribosomal-protein-alanine N-acetyltransferase